MLTGKGLEDRIRKARTALLLDAPFLGTLALKLALVDMTGRPGPHGGGGTIATDGTRFYYWGEWVDGLTDAELVGGWAHEVGHCMLFHPYRMGDRDGLKWNIAADYAENPLIVGQFTLPKGALLDQQYADMSAEQIYALLPDPPKGEDGGWGVVLKASKGQPGQGDGQGEDADGEGPGRPGGGGDMTELDWAVAIEQAAMVARKAGRMPGEWDALVCGALWGRSVDWREKLRAFMVARVASDWSWRVPSRRAMAAGGAGGLGGGDMIYPGIAKDGAPRMGGILDVSGSVGSDAIAACMREVAAIVREVRPVEFTLVLCDSEVREVLRYDPDTFPDGLPSVRYYAGGTAFAPGLEWFVRERDRGGADEPVACVVYMTADAENWDTEETRAAAERLGVPLLWAVDAQAGREALRSAGSGGICGVGEVVMIDTSRAAAHGLRAVVGAL